jgi:DNA-directed RNA polymerase subunit M/transcription elongation factor TFIIS
MLYSVEEDTAAVLACRKCAYREPLSRDNPVVYEHILKQDNSETLALNPYLKHDPTLEHLTTLTCPNHACPSRVMKLPGDVVAVELDVQKLVWMYQCAHCDNAWKQKGRAT